MKLTQLLFASALTLLLSTAAMGEYYKYTDKAGIVHYTDDLCLVPENQRPDVAIFEPDMVREAVRPNPGANDDALPEGDKAGERQKKKAALDRQKEHLLETYKDLNEKRKALGDPPPEHAKSGIKAEYIRKSEELNRKIQEYNQLSEAFERQTNEYNNGKR